MKDIIQGHKILSKIDASKVFDKVRSFIKEAESQASEQALPTVLKVCPKTRTAGLLDSWTLDCGLWTMDDAHELPLCNV